MKNIVIPVAAGGVIMLWALGIAWAVSDDTTETQASDGDVVVVESTSPQAERHADMLEQLVEDGVITQDQADAFGAMPGAGRFGFGRGFGGGDTPVVPDFFRDQDSRREFRNFDFKVVPMPDGFTFGSGPDGDQPRRLPRFRMFPRGFNQEDIPGLEEFNFETMPVPEGFEWFGFGELEDFDFESFDFGTFEWFKDMPAPEELLNPESSST